MNKQLLLALQKRSNERLVELRTQVENPELRAEDLPAIQEEIDEINKQLQEVADALANLEDDGEGDEGEGSGEGDEGGSSGDEGSSGSGEGGEGRSGNPEGNAGVSPEQRQAAMAAIKSALSTRNAKSTKTKEKEIRSAFANFVVGNISEMEARALGIEAGNGSVTVPEVIASEIITYAQEENFLRRLGQGVKTTGNMKYPILVKKATAQGHKKERTGSNPIPETDIEFDEVYLEPTEFDALATVTKKLLKQSGLPIEQIVMDELKKAYVRKEVRYMVHGDETDNVNPGALAKKAVEYKPTAEDVELYDQLVSMKNSVPKVVRKKARWVLNTAAITKIEKMKTKDGFPLLKPLEQAQDGCDYKLLGYLVEEEEEISKEGQEDTPVFYFGDFSSFKIQDVTGSLELEVLRELFTNTNRVGFKLYSLLDAQLIYSPFEPTVYRYEVKASTGA
ncbi:MULTISPECIES: phage major capsid protein [Bacillus]|uniref:phage major capsid protein n=1 Tax=Bacillus TaxID=1386 RepID=UPI0005A331D2|nr:MULTISPECIES: phage major capsid protein [Bacillus cereus group]AJG59409.1 phage major capsid protein, HK97 family [Bacillus cereus D17]QKI12753.1 phage major capsid protein [Bacillus cereus]USL01995.1 phage major capsid protein [Bacillus anthracis]